MVTARLGQKPECRRPSSIKLYLIDGRRTPVLELLPFRSRQIRRRRIEGGKFRIFFSWHRGQMYADVKKEKKIIRSIPFHAIIFAAIRRSGRQQFASARRLSIMRSFHGPRMPALKLSPSGSPQIQGLGMEGGEFRFFYLDVGIRR